MYNLKSGFVVFILGFMLLTGGCEAKGILETIYSGSFPEAQTIYIYNGSTYIPNGSNLEKINQNGKKTVLSRNDLNIFMDFVSHIKTIGTTTNMFLLLDSNDTLVGQVNTFDGGVPVLSKNGQVLAIMDHMEEVTKIFSVSDGALLWDFKGVRTALDITPDGKTVFTSNGEMLSLDTKSKTYLPECESYQIVRVLGSGILFASIGGRISFHNITGELRWTQSLDKTSYFTLVKDSKVIAYTKDQVRCLNVENGQQLWEMSYEEVLLNVLPLFNEADYAVFQTSDQTLHILDENGEELIKKSIGEVNQLRFGEDLIVIHREGVENNIEVIKVIE